MADYNLYKNDIENRFSPSSLTDAAEGSGFRATAIISAVTTTSGWKMSQLDAYKSLRDTLLDGDDTPLFMSTTSQRNALTNIEPSTLIDNITIKRNEIFNGANWVSTTRIQSISGITASTTQTQGNGLLTGDLNVIDTVANSGDTVTLPAAEAGKTCIIFNKGAKAVSIFPGSADDLGVGLNTLKLLSAGSVIVFYSWDDTFWLHFGDTEDDGAALSSYGAMFEDNNTGSAINATTSYVGWVTAIAGVVDANSLVTFVGNGTADRLTVGPNGAGDYMIDFHVNFTNSGGKETTASIHVNGSEQVSIKMTMPGDSGKAAHMSSADILTLANNDFVDLRFKSESSDTVTVFNVNVNMVRV